MPGYYPGPAAMPNFPPPLPAGWSEHNAPDGVTKYYYNSNTKESTYTRPSFAPLPQAQGTQASGSQVKEKKKKKEKPKQTVEIPGTSWTRVTTSDGNVFYFEKESKRSEWTIPDEIKEAVAAMDQAEKEEKEREEREKREKEEKERIERIKERERIRLQVEEERERKRKAGDGDEDAREPKKVKEDEYEPEGEEDQEAWAKAVAAEFADQDAATKLKEDEDKAKAEREEEEAAKKVFSAPGKVNVSVAEGRALFKVSSCCLSSRSILMVGPVDRERYLAICAMGSISPIVY